MSADWNAYFQTGYTPEDVADAARAVLSRQAEKTSVVEQLLLMDMISEIACKLRFDAEGPKRVKVLVISPDGHFKDIKIQRTSQYAAFGTARKLGLVTDQMLHDLAEQSASASVVAQVIENGDSPDGMIVQTVPLGFEGFIKDSQPKRGFLSRLLGQRA